MDPVALGRSERSRQGGAKPVRAVDAWSETVHAALRNRAAAAEPHRAIGGARLALARVGEAVSLPVVVVSESVGRPVARAGEKQLLVIVAGSKDEAPLVAAGASEDAQVIDRAVSMLRGARVRAGFDSVHPAAGDDVDHAADGVGPVDGGGAVLEDLDALDGGSGDRV